MKDYKLITAVFSINSHIEVFDIGILFSKQKIIYILTLLDFLSTIRIR